MYRDVCVMAIYSCLNIFCHFVSCSRELLSLPISAYVKWDCFLTIKCCGSSEDMSILLWVLAVLGAEEMEPT